MILIVMIAMVSRVLFCYVECVSSGADFFRPICDLYPCLLNYPPPPPPQLCETVLIIAYLCLYYIIIYVSSIVMLICVCSTALTGCYIGLNGPILEY